MTVLLSNLQNAIRLFEIHENQLTRSLENLSLEKQNKSPENDNKKPSCPGAFG